MWKRSKHTYEWNSQSGGLDFWSLLRWLISTKGTWCSREWFSTHIYIWTPRPLHSTRPLNHFNLWDRPFRTWPQYSQLLIRDYISQYVLDNIDSLSWISTVNKAETPHMWFYLHYKYLVLSHRLSIYSTHASISPPTLTSLLMHAAHRWHSIPSV